MEGLIKEPALEPGIPKGDTYRDKAGEDGSAEEQRSTCLGFGLAEAIKTGVGRITLLSSYIQRQAHLSQDWD